ncbi:hypothetical protein AVEN_226895-1 [Araneus ventricosus]|uniref:Uncharacterized protein n=1 Tax=Araneus ventricosus TaxID=182803 RepID=A0A4Y2BHM6_ARAVE|nr:hypothetical protein AVEN_226895-1 [Araneus ventricosus]
MIHREDSYNLVNIITRPEHYHFIASPTLLPARAYVIMSALLTGNVGCNVHSPLFESRELANSKKLTYPWHVFTPGCHMLGCLVASIPAPFMPGLFHSVLLRQHHHR